MQLFTDDAPTIAIVRPTFKFLVPYIAASMVRSVMYGMAWAMQEFGWIAVIAGVGTATYVPMALYAKYALDDVTLLTLMEISLYAGLVRTALIGVLCLWYIPRKLARPSMRGPPPRCASPGGPPSPPPRPAPPYSEAAGAGGACAA